MALFGVLDGQPMANGLCTGKFTTGGYWNVTTHCDYDLPLSVLSAVTYDLQRLSQVVNMLFLYLLPKSLH